METITVLTKVVAMKMMNTKRFHRGRREWCRSHDSSRSE